MSSYDRFLNESVISIYSKSDVDYPVLLECFGYTATGRTCLFTSTFKTTEDAALVMSAWCNALGAHAGLVALGLSGPTSHLLHSN